MYIYRGVHAKHPALKDAKSGVVRPGNPKGLISPEQHNKGGFAAMSPYTSWTLDRHRAVWWANREGVGGVVLTVPEGKPMPKDEWCWVWSQDRWCEDEILLKGIRLNVEVTEP